MTKKQIINFIQKMPNDSSVEDVMYELYFKMQVDQGLDDIKNNRTVSHEKVVNESLKWLKS
jgi:predicted transcriptional regulator